MDERGAQTVDGRVVDGRERASGASAWAWLLAVALVVASVDWVLGRAPTAAVDAPGRDPTTLELRQTLREAAAIAAGGQRSLLLIGDSVLAGDVMDGRVEGWRSQRVIDHMRAELGPSDAQLRQIALEGLLPLDAVHVLAELDRLDPRGAVELVLEINLRYFSDRYRAQDQCTRDELCALGQLALAQTKEAGVLALLESAALADGWLRERTPVHRRRARLEQLELGAIEGLAVARDPSIPPTRTRASEGLARVQEHYRSATLTADHSQVRALVELLDRVHARGRRASLFLTPLDDDFVRATLPANGLGRRLELLARLVNDHPAGEHGLVALLNLDHPLFESANFLDHVHLDARGNRVLALNLVHELGLPLATRPHASMMIHGEDHDRSLIHRRDLGYADGGPWQALLSEPQGVAVSRDGQRIVIADTGNHALRLLRGTMQIVERLAGEPMRAGGRDGGALDHARLTLPHSPELLGARVYFLDGPDSSRVRELADGFVRTLSWTGRHCPRYDALLDRPQGVAVDRQGTRVVVADTQNHVLRQLRTNLQFVETIAGRPGEPGHRDGDALERARLTEPRDPELLGEAVWFIDGEAREHLRVLEHGSVRTASWRGPSCPGYLRLRARASADGHGALWMLCDDNRVLHLDLERGLARTLSEVSMSPLVSFDLGPEHVYFADVDGRLWRRPLVAGPEGPQLGAWDIVFRNVGDDLMPSGFRVGFPYRFDDLRLARVVDLRWIERYGGLLVADEFPAQTEDPRLQREWTERVHLRYFDLDAGRVLPWIKAIPHGEGHVLVNEAVDQLASYWHLGSLAVVQDDASLVWVERERSRIVRVADGLLGMVKTGNHHARGITLPRLTTIASVSHQLGPQLRPDRFLDARWEPIPRRGPYVALLLGSSLSSMSDRFANYSLGRRLELELQRELGYRDNLRLDLFQISWPAGSLGEQVDNFANWMAVSVPPDVVFIEAHDFGAGYLRHTDTPQKVNAALAQLQRLAERYQTLVVFHDLSSIEANRREAMRSTDAEVQELLGKARRLGFVVLEPGDRLLPQLLMHSPWGSQPFADNQHHGSSWAVELSAATLASMVAPILSERFATREPARLRERPASEFDARERAREPLRAALDAVAIARAQLPELDRAYVQTHYADRELHVYVDVAGFRDALVHERREFLERLAVAVIVAVLDDDLYAELAESLRVELVEFANYDEYGNGVVASAQPLWRRSFDRASLHAFLLEHAPR